MEKNLVVKQIISKENLGFITIGIGAIGLLYIIANKLIEKGYNFEFDIKNPKITIYK